jgi:hypothetical protein
MMQATQTVSSIVPLPSQCMHIKGSAYSAVRQPRLSLQPLKRCTARQVAARRIAAPQRGPIAVPTAAAAASSAVTVPSQYG